MKQERAIVANDFHFPFQDNKLITLWFRFMQDFEPDTIIIDGDLIDAWQLSKFDHNPREGKLFKEEVNMAEDFWHKVRTLFPKANLVYIYGNHEFRLQSYIVRNAEALAWFDEFSLEDLMHLKQYDVEVVNVGLKENFYKFGDLFIGHFNKVSKDAGMTARNLVQDRMVNIMQAHVHRVGLSIKRGLDGKFYGAWENGCMCNLNPNYLSMPNWCHGFSIVYKWQGDNRFQVDQIPIIKYQFRWGDKIYKI